MIEAIEAVRDKRTLTPELISEFIEGVVGGRIPDYQIAAWLMAAYLNGLDEASVFALTRAMAETGTSRIDYGGIVDKHSTGGVGDKTTLILAPIVAVLGVPMVKMSGRGLGHTGGTLDKLESIPGFKIELTASEVRRQLERVGVAVIAQSTEMAPADGILYALRDVTGTVDSIPLIASSIMSKKLAAGAPNLVLDVKVGSGALMKTEDRARQLAHLMLRIGQAHHIRTTAILTNMDQPLGQAVGNALEVNEAVHCLKGMGPRDLEDEVVTLASHMVSLAESQPLPNVEPRVRQVLHDGRAYERFCQWIEAQGGDIGRVEAGLPVASRRSVTLRQRGAIAAIDTAKVGLAAQTLGAGRLTKEDGIDFGVGVRWLAPIGSEVHADTPVAEIYARDEESAEHAQRIIEEAVTLGHEAVPKPPVFHILSNA